MNRGINKRWYIVRLGNVDYRELDEESGRLMAISKFGNVRMLQRLL